MVRPLSCATEDTAQKAALLLVDDDQLITESLGFLLKKYYDVHIAETRAEAREKLHAMARMPELALIDLGLPPLPHQADEGFALIKDLLTADPAMKVLVLSGQSQEANIHHALTLGAVDFVPKPANPDLLKARLEHHLMLQKVEIKKEKSVADSALIGDSSSMQVLRQQIGQFADSCFPVLIEGESGTGKELIAKALHQQSTRSDKPYLVINCAAISGDLLEAQLFGYIKGAFTGAVKNHQGFFAEAGDGVLFLDEIGELPYELQAKLLRVLESGEYYRVGDTEPKKSKARIIAATNKNLNVEVKEGRFRSDLFHRLSILKIQVPALRDREDDARRLLMHFQDFYEDSIMHFSLDAAAKTLWSEYGFPGNVRELRNIVIRLGTKNTGKIIGYEKLAEELEMDMAVKDVEKLKQDFDAGLFNDAWLYKQISTGEFELDKALAELEGHCMHIAFEMHNGNLSKVARALNINRTTLYSRMHRNAEKANK